MVYAPLHESLLGRLFRLPVLAGGVLLILLAGYFFFRPALPFLPAPAPQIDPNSWQVVFLTNGQSYFGHLSGWEGNNPVLTKVYYVRAAGPASPPGGKKESDQKIDVIKLGGEFYGPQDALFLSKQQVIFVENLKDKSEVVDIIKKYESGQK